MAWKLASGRDESAGVLICRLGMKATPSAFEDALSNITRMIGARAVLFCFDLTNSISILAREGEGAINEAALYELDVSPVGDAIREGAPVVENWVSKKAQGKYKKLLNLLPFESCIGIPVKVHSEILHAVFFFHSQPNAFPARRGRDALAGAVVFTALLEENVLNQRLRSLNPLLISGELAAGFGHEVGNKVTG
jgi:transcriptional regulator with GAF, ATPase, and Fis domain